MDEFEVNQQLAIAHEVLSQWQSPEDFIKRVQAADQLLESPVLFNKSNINFLFDALSLAEFVRLDPPEMVRLASPKEQWPDGFIGNPKVFRHIEITEVMEPGRRRGDEYRLENLTKKPELDRPENWRERGAQIPKALENAIKKKMAKNYATKPVLVVDLNIGEYGLLQKETIAAIASSKAQYTSAFDDIRVIWKGVLY